MSSASEVLCIAGISIRIRYADESLRCPLSETSSRFAITSSAEANVTVTIDAMPAALPPPGRLLFYSRPLHPAFHDPSYLHINCSILLSGNIPHHASLL